MRICTTAVFLVITLNLGEYSGTLTEPCREDFDCLGHTLYNGIRCKSRVCQCVIEDTCKDYDSIAQQANTVSCTSWTDCVGSDTYPGIKCNAGKCQCIKHYGCGDCLPKVEVFGLAETPKEVCIFDYLAEVPTWTINLTSDIKRTDICPGKWTLHWEYAVEALRVYKSDNFVASGDPVANAQPVSQSPTLSTWKLEGLDFVGVVMIDILFRITSDLGYDMIDGLLAYFLTSCAKTFEETNDARYDTSNSNCADAASEVSQFGYTYTHEVPPCSGVMHKASLAGFQPDISSCKIAFNSQSRSYYPLYLVCTSRDWAALSCIVHQPNSECTNASCSVIDISDASITLSVKRTIFISEDLFSFGNVRCPVDCALYQNAQVKNKFTVHITGCSFHVKVMELVVKKCSTENYWSCTSQENEEIVDITRYFSIEYKPREENLSWNYHGLFVTVLFSVINSMKDRILIKFGPTPEAGSCTIAPASGYALTTPYNIICSDFTIKDGFLLLKYSVFSHTEPDFEKASKLFTSLSPNRSNILLPPGRAANNYMVYLWVKAYTYYGESAIVPIQTQVYLPGQVADLCESFLAVEAGADSSQVGDLISSGDTEGAVQLLTVIASSLNEDSETKPEAVSVVRRTTVRTTLVSMLTEIPVSDFETVLSTTAVLNEATKVTDEISDGAQDVATGLYGKLADGFDSLLGSQDKAEVDEMTSSLLHGVTRILDVNIDIGNKEMENVIGKVENVTSGEEDPVLATEKLQHVKNTTTKLLKTIDTVYYTMVKRQDPGEDAYAVVMDTMTVSIQKLTIVDQLSSMRSGSSGTRLTVTGASNSSGDIKLPDMSGHLSDGQDYGVKMLYMEKNPYLWDTTAKDITSPVLSLSLTTHNESVDVQNLADPVVVTLPNPNADNGTVIEETVLIQKNGEMFTMANNTLYNMLNFNISTQPGRTISLNIVPWSNITFKMLIKSDQEPTYDDLISEGFLYPDEIPRSLFANYSYLKSEFLPLSSEEIRKIYLTPNNSLSLSSNFSGVYYIGLSLDLNHTETKEGLQQLYPECLGSNQSSCQEMLNIEVNYEASEIGCFYWNEGSDTWSTQGCEVSPYSTKDTIECMCTHLSSFSAGVSSLIVVPNLVDPFDVELFLTFFDNPVVVTAVIIVWVIYFFLIHWARQADKKDLERVGVLNCPDNNPSNNYLYLVCVVTGWWRDAGTSANVFVSLKGSKGTSSSHCLTATPRPCFQTGSEDWFLVTTEQSLGHLQNITLWHDNMGSGPHWYLNHVFVKDVQLEKSWHFIYNDWLAVDRGSLQQTSATLEAVTETELKFKAKHNFMVKSKNDLRDGHLWLSIFSKPAKSTFTRVQRLSCALSLLLTTMLTNIMFYGVPTDDPEDQVGVAGSISINLSAIIIGIESSLIMFPVNLIILQLFLKAKPKPRRKIKALSESELQLQRIYERSREITNLVMLGILERRIKISKSGGMSGWEEGSDMDLEERFILETKESLSSGKWSNMSYDQGQSELGQKSISEIRSSVDQSPPSPPKSPKTLPWWILYIAWFLVISTSLVSSYFVMLYGLKYGYNKSVSWLVSFLTGFTQSACVTQPVKVLAIAVVVTMIFKKPAEFDDFGPDTELDEDEVYLHNVRGAKEIHHPTIQPLSKSLLEKIRQRLHLEWLMDMTLRDIVFYVIYVAVVTFMVHGNRDVKLAYRNKVAIENVLVTPSCVDADTCYSLEEANTVEGMFEYFEEVLVPALADMSIADHDYATIGSNHFLLGPCRLRQKRIRKGMCHQTKSSVLKRFDQDFPDCKSSYSVDDEDTGSYNNSWELPMSHQSSGNDPDIWTYQSSSKLKTISYSGEHATYSGGGFVLEMPTDADLVSLLNNIQNTDWIDPHTRAVLVEFTLYNPNADLFSVVVIIFEFSNVGGVFPNHHIFTTKLYHYSTNIGPYVVACEILFLLFNIAFTFIEIRRFKKLGRKEYFEDTWSFAEIIQLAVSYTVVGLFFQRLVSASSILDQYRDSDGQKFVSFYTAVFWDEILGYVLAFQVAFVTLKSLKLLRFNKKTFMITDTITFSKPYLLSFMFMFTLFMVAFGQFTTLVFGTVLSENKSFGDSLITLFNFALDSSDLLGLYEISRILGPIYFVIFIVFTQWCLLTILVAILNFGISESKAKAKSRRSRFELVNYIVRKLKTFL